MKTLETLLFECHNTHAKANGIDPMTAEEWQEVLKDEVFITLIEAGKEYASQLIDDHLQRAADNATMVYHCGHSKVDLPTKHHQQGADNIQIDKASIINTEKILL